MDNLLKSCSSTAVIFLQQFHVHVGSAMRMLSSSFISCRKMHAPLRKWAALANILHFLQAICW